VPELERLIAEHPFRERLREHHIVALYRSGRQSDALEAYRAARRTLSEELGVEPAPELRELERAILRHDPALAAPEVAPGAPLALPVPPTPLVGRRLEVIAEELADLAIVRLRESIDAGGNELPVDERRLTRARRSVEKAIVLLREPDDTL
jgi:hypothetical protein